MPVITRSGGKVTSIWGGAQIKDQHGKMQPLHVGDTVKTGDVILTTQNGIVRISDLAGPVAAAKATEPSDTDRVISGLNQGDLDVAPGAGLVGGDGGSLSEGFRVGRITEGVTPASMGLPQYEESTLEDLPNVIRAEVLPLALVPVEPPPPPPPAPPPPPPPAAPPATVSLSASQDYESDTAGYTFTATLSAKSQGVTTIVTDQGVITINDGQTSGSITVGVGSNPDDVYVDPTSLMATITSASGGNFGQINVGTGSAEARIDDTKTPVTTSLGTEPVPLTPPTPFARFAFARSFSFEEEAPAEAPVSLSAAAVEDSVTVPEGQRARFTLSATLTEPSQGQTTLVTNLDDGNGGFRAITIEDGQTTGSIEIEIYRPDDVYLDAYTQTITITSGSGGNFEFIDLSTGSASTTITITDVPTPEVVTLTATESVTEGGFIVYTVSLDNPVEDSPLVITLNNGTTITIPVGSSSANGDPVPVRADDYYVQGEETVTATITGTSGGNFEELDISTFGSASTLVSDDFDATTVTLTATESVTEGGFIVYTASLDNPVEGSPLVITLNNGTTISIPVGSSSADGEPVPVRADDPYVQGTDTITATITGTSGGNFEALNTSSTASTLVTDNDDVTTVNLSGSSVTEGPSVSYVFTATLSQPSEGVTTVTTDQGVITIANGDTTGTLTLPASNGEDVYLDATSLTATITSATGGNFENLVLGINASATAHITDTTTPVTVSLIASADFEGSNAGYTFTATLSAASQGVSTIVTDQGTIYIQDGDTTGSITVYVPPNGEDVYVDPSSLTATITSATGGNFEDLEIGTGSATATIVDTINDVTVDHSGSSVTEGPSVSYVFTATLSAPSQGMTTVTTDQGVITIANGATTGTLTLAANNGEDVYVDATSLTATITSATGGNFENLVVGTNASATAHITDTIDTTTVQLLSSRQDGSGNYVVIASIDNAPQNTPLVLRLSNGASLTFGVGQTKADSTAVAVPKVPADSPELIVSVTSAEGGNFEALNTEDTVVAPLVISVDIPVVTPITNPLGLSVEYYGYNDFNPTSGNANRQHSDDGTFDNLDSVAKVTALINGRNADYKVGDVVGSTVAAEYNAPDVRFTASSLDYGRINPVNNSLGTNITVPVGGNIRFGTSALFKFISKTADTTGVKVTVTKGTEDNDNLGTGPTSGLGKTSDAAMRFTGQAYLEAGLYDIRVTADAGFRLQLDNQTVAIFDGVQTATTRVYSGVAVEGGLTPLELLYWDEGGSAVLRVEFKLSTDTTYKVLGSDALPLYSNVHAPVLTELQDLVAGPTPGSYAVRTGSLLQGGAGDDHLTGGDARDHLIGGDGRDVLAGGAASDVIEGGQGDDHLTGGLSSDVFRWSLGDASSTATPAHDVISDFDNTSYAGDVLDLRDLLIGETHAANTTTLPDPIGLTNALKITTNDGNLADYLHFTKVGSDTVIEISSEGKFTAGSHAAVDQVITLTGINLVGSFTDDNQVINDLLARGKLITDVA